MEADLQNVSEVSEQFAGKHLGLSYNFSKWLQIKDHFVWSWASLGISTPRRVFQGWFAWLTDLRHGCTSAVDTVHKTHTARPYAAWRGNYVCIFIVGMLPVIMKLSLTVRNHQANRVAPPHPPVLCSGCGTDASLLVLWLCLHPPIAGDRCQDQQGPCLNIAVINVP